VATSEGNMRYNFREKIIERVQADKAASLLAELLNMIGFYLYRSNQSYSSARRAG